MDAPTSFQRIVRHMFCDPVTRRRERSLFRLQNALDLVETAVVTIKAIFRHERELAVYKERRLSDNIVG